VPHRRAGGRMAHHCAGGWLTMDKAKGQLIEPALQLVAHTGFEPVISSLRGRCPRPLDECALAVCYQHVYSTLCS
jgi:hypothetical protein